MESEVFVRSVPYWIPTPKSQQMEAFRRREKLRKQTKQANKRKLLGKKIITGYCCSLLLFIKKLTLCCELGVYYESSNLKEDKKQECGKIFSL